MFSNYVFAFSVLSLLVMGQPGTVRAADSCQPVFLTASPEKLLRLPAIAIPQGCEW